ncbi:hypothetical protein HanRHA438_Chr13g0618761 [Helianthus annuus]|nr:hypothetical protein HanIR_Chr13g0660631 [Helianthus annuus]KAJ0483052.1 hypothetical protein HanIR_Chr13g0660651 [Helianthus annuus]KAJ0859984.1 hypothetical protein HanRHA438_Chr13g0618751 [Helianthus annuus]KAJ0859985.1 hypothetical protein HanRHA438_Chr13g0618761 [Helianthus annuus]
MLVHAVQVIAQVSNALKCLSQSLTGGYMSHPNNTPKTNGEVHYPYSATIVKAELHTRIKRSHSTK